MAHEILLAIGVLCGVSGSLALLLLIAEHFLADYGECEIDVNDGERKFRVQGGGSLLSSLGEEKLFIPSACGGRGSCGFCKCRVVAGGGPVLPTETPYLTADEIANGTRLSCQIKVKENLRIQVPEELLAVREFITTIEKIDELTHDIRGLRFRLPEGENIKFKAGQYMQLVAPPYNEIRESTSRAYSISSPPSQAGSVELVIRLVPEGIVTTYVFEHLQPGHTARLVGPFGDFYLRQSRREIIFIAGGSGLAPIRSLVLDMIDRKITDRKATFFFGARTTSDLYYVDDFKALAREHDWFDYVPILSADSSDHGYRNGLVTDAVAEDYPDLDNHEAYLCGSPGMIDACEKVLTGKGMPADMIFYDKFS